MAIILYACMLWPCSTKQLTIRLFFPRILAVVCGGLWWFVCISLVSLPIVQNSGGDLRWFAVVCDGLR